MKNYFYVIIVLALTIACKKKEVQPETPVELAFVAPNTFEEIGACDLNNFYLSTSFHIPSFGVRSTYSSCEISYDGGVTWISKSSPMLGGFKSYIVSQDKFYIYNNQLEYSSDGGNTFEVLDSTITHDLTFLAPNIGIKTGIDIFKTTDGGHTWFKTYDSPGMTGAKQIQFPTSTVGYSNVSFEADGSGFGEIIKTTDGGSTWQTVFPDAGFAILDIDFLSTNVGFFTCSDGNLYKTTDGGVTWNVVTYLNASVAYYFFNIEFVSQKEGYAWGTNDGRVYLTRDAGLTWQLVVNSTCDEVTNVQRVGNLIFISGLNGLLLKSN